MVKMRHRIVAVKIQGVIVGGHLRCVYDFLLFHFSSHYHNIMGFNVLLSNFLLVKSTIDRVGYPLVI